MNFSKKDNGLEIKNKNAMNKTNVLLYTLFLIIVVSSCTKPIDYSAEYMEQTSGRYLFDEENIIDVLYKDKHLFIKLGGVKIIEPVILDKKTFFVADIYKKLRFVQHPETQKRYLSIISEDNEDAITYDYLKVDDAFNTPSMYLENGDYDNALAGYLEIKKQDSTSVLLDEGNFNRIGYSLLRRKEYENAISVFKMNVVLYPESGNVYDSLGDAYLAHGDSLQAFNNYKKTLEYNDGNGKARRFVEAYNKKEN